MRVVRIDDDLKDILKPTREDLYLTESSLRSSMLSATRATIKRPLTASLRNRSLLFLTRTMATAGSLDVTHEIKLDHDNVRDLWSR